jgi:hypothetical protein
MLNDGNLESRRKAFGKPPPSLLSVGVCIRNVFQFYEFSKIKADPKKYVDGIISDQVRGYYAYLNGDSSAQCPRMPGGLKNVSIPADRWKTDIEGPINAILEQAEGRRRELRQVLLKSPYASLAAK